MRRIRVTENIYTKVDDEDFDKFKGYCLNAAFRYNRFYVGTRSHGKSAYLHRLIMNAPKGTQVDHINHDSLDNRKENLRICLASQNQANRRGANKNSTTGIPGVSYLRKRGNLSKRYVAKIKVNWKKIHLGYFLTKEEARDARLVAVKKYFGEFGRT